MIERILLILLAVLMIVMIRFAPHLLRFRIRILRKFRLNWAARLLENRFSAFVVVIRVLCGGIGLVLLSIALA